jgi:hypothetical protein
MMVEVKTAQSHKKKDAKSHEEKTGPLHFYDLITSDASDRRISDPRGFLVTGWTATQLFPARPSGAV